MNNDAWILRKIQVDHVRRGFVIGIPGNRSDFVMRSTPYNVELIKSDFHPKANPVISSICRMHSGVIAVVMD